MVANIDTAQLLPEIDADFLEEKGFVFDLSVWDGEIHAVIRDFDFGTVYVPHKADLLIIIPAGYPNSQLDMFWTYPDVKLQSGAWPAQAEVHKQYGERSWQRWSRHYQQPWRPGVDSLRTFMASIRAEISKGI